MHKKSIGIVIVTVIILIGGAVLLLGKSPSSKVPTEIVKTPTPIPSIESFDANSKTVLITTNGFQPQTVTIKKTMRVVWVNKTNDLASVYSANHPTHLVYPRLNLGSLKTNYSVQLIFDTPGSYDYHDHYHPSHTGTIKVE